MSLCLNCRLFACYIRRVVFLIGDWPSLVSRCVRMCNTPPNIEFPVVEAAFWQHGSLICAGQWPPGLANPRDCFGCLVGLCSAHRRPIHMLLRISPRKLPDGFTNRLPSCRTLLPIHSNVVTGTGTCGIAFCMAILYYGKQRNGKFYLPSLAQLSAYFVPIVLIWFSQRRSRKC